MKLHQLKPLLDQINDEENGAMFDWYKTLHDAIRMIQKTDYNYIDPVDARAVQMRLKRLSAILFECSTRRKRNPKDA